MSFTAVVDALLRLRPYDPVGVRKIRLGAPNDGGYVLLDLLARRPMLFSYGVGGDIRFELDLARRGIRGCLFDHTVAAPQDLPEGLSFYPQGVSSRRQPDGATDTLAAQINRHAPRGARLMLKMDVEGAEWASLDKAPAEVLARFDQIIIELHDFQKISDPIFRRRVVRVLDKLNAMFALVHVHGNCHGPLQIVEGLPVAPVIEALYVNRELAAVVPSTGLFPSALDRSNWALWRDMPLWFFPFLPWGSGPDGADGGIAVRKAARRLVRQIQPAA
jgi:hypothetical protein